MSNRLKCEDLSIMLEENEKDGKRKPLSTMSVLLFTRPKLPQVELKLLALQNVTIRTTALTWPARDASVQTTSIKHRLESGFNFSVLEPQCQLLSLKIPQTKNKPFLRSSRTRLTWFDCFFSASASAPSAAAAAAALLFFETGWPYYIILVK